MAIGRIPPSEIEIEPSLVRALLGEQHADLAQLPLIELGSGWDNTLYRLGDSLVVRLPRRAAAAALIEHEQRWLPEIAPRLPLPTPVPVRIGRPGHGFPWAWSVVPWLEGESVLTAPPIDDDTWLRARGWALALGLAYLASSLDNPGMGAIGRTAVDAAIGDRS